MYIFAKLIENKEIYFSLDTYNVEHDLYTKD